MERKSQILVNHKLRSGVNGPIRACRRIHAKNPLAPQPSTLMGKKRTGILPSPKAKTAAEACPGGMGRGFWLSARRLCWYAHRRRNMPMNQVLRTRPNRGSANRRAASFFFEDLVICIKPIVSDDYLSSIFGTGLQVLSSI
jgi:hypothetical protein